MKSKEIHIDPITGKKYPMIGEHVFNETLSPMMIILYCLGTYKITYRSTTDGPIAGSFLLCPRPGQPSYFYKIKWRYWNPLTIISMLVITILFTIVAFVWQGISGVIEMLGQLLSEFIHVEEQYA